MADPFDIYQQHADTYDALVSAEDHAQNLNALLHREVDFQHKVVVEAGLGTGRVTALYMKKAQRIVGFDQSQHMLDFAWQKLGSPPNLQMHTRSHEQIPWANLNADIFIEGWALGHWFLALGEHFEPAFNTFFNQVRQALNPGGAMILIETLGTFRETPFQDTPLNEFYAYLEQDQGFHRHVIRTDYVYDSVAQARDMMGFFFGNEMAQKIESDGLAQIPEVTGVWIQHVL